MSENGIGEISVRLGASVSGADRSIQKLIGYLNNLQDAINRVDPSKLDNFNNAVKSMGNFSGYADGIRQIKSAMQSLARVDTTKFNNALESIKEMAKIDLSNLEAIKGIDFSGIAKMGGIKKIADEAKEAARTTKESMEDIGKSATEAEKPFSRATREMSKGLSGIKFPKINADGFLSGLKGIGSAVKAVGNGIAEGVRITLGSAIKALTEVIQFATPYIKAFGKTLFNLGLSLGKNTIGGIAKLSTEIGKLASGFGVLTSKHGLFSKGLSGGFMTVLRYAFGIRSLFVLFNKLRNVISTGVGNLAKQNANVNASVSMLVTTLNQLKGSVVSAFAPALQAIAAPLSSLIQLFADGAAKVAAFISALTGKNMMIKATASAADYAKSLDKSSSGAGKGMGAAADSAKELEESLATMSFDELNQLQDMKDPSKSGGGSGGSGGGSGDVLSEITYEESEVPKAIKAYVDLIKESWKEADFTELGDIVGDKLNRALQKIPWEKVEETGKKLGSSFATFLNGVFGSELNGDTLGTTIGDTVAGAINTVLGTQNGFVTKLEFDTLGTFLSDAVNSMLSDIKYDTFKESCESIGRGIATAINAFATPKTLGNFGSSIGRIVSSAISGAKEFVTSADFVGFGDSIATGINEFFRNFDAEAAGITFSGAVGGLLRTFKEAIGKVSWSGIGYKIRDMLKEIEWGEILKSAASLVGEAFVGAIDFAKALTDSSEYGKAVHDLKTINDDISKALEDLDGWKDKVPDTSFIDNLADQYFALAENVDKLSQSDYNNMVLIAGQLVTAIPELEKYYNAETGMLETTRDEINKYIDALKRKALQEAAQDAMKGYIEQQINAKKAMQDAENTVDDLANAEKRINGYIAEQDKLLANGDITLEQYDATVSQYNASLRQVQDQQKEANEEWGKAKDAYDSAQEGANNLGKEMEELEKELFGSTSSAKKFAKEIKNIPNDIKVKMEADPSSLNFKEKVKVVASVTGLDQKELSKDKAKVEGIYAEITKADTKSGYTPKVSVNALMKQITDQIPSNNKFISNMKGVLSSWNKGNGFNNIISGFTGWISSFQDKIPSWTKTLTGFAANIGSYLAKLIHPQATGGIYSGGFWKNIPQFASGGVPTRGTMFVAGERGAEAVAHINGQTEVLNASQLASAIYSAVRSAMAQTVGSYLQPMALAMRETVIASANSINTNIGNIGASFANLTYMGDVADLIGGIDIEKSVSDGFATGIAQGQMMQLDPQKLEEAIVRGMVTAMAMNDGNQRPINITAELVTPSKEVMGRYVMEGIEKIMDRRSTGFGWG